MTGPDNPLESLEDLQFHSDVLAELVSVLNAFGQYLGAPVGSDEEKEWEVLVDQLTTSIVDGKMAGHVMLGMANIIHLFADGDGIQEWLEHQRVMLEQRAKELGYDTHD